jgi:PTH1 family peptidyl-tRNA hydrolase
VKLVVGLGNPGARYAGTRHNVGFRVVRALAHRLSIQIDRQRFDGLFGQAAVDGAGEVGFLLPLTFMNRSGDSVAQAVDALGVEPGLQLAASDVLVCYDDLDLPFAQLRLRSGGGAGGHNGIANVIDALGTAGVARLRVGVGRPPYGDDPIDYVLGDFAPEQEAVLPACLERAGDAILCALREGLGSAMSEFNRAARAEINGHTPDPDCPDKK